MGLGTKLCAIACLLWPACAPGNEPTAALQVSADRVQPEGLPVLLTLTLHNTRAEPLYFWPGGSGGYPDASRFVATVMLEGTDRAVRRERLSNCGREWANASVRCCQLTPGVSLAFPAALRPLPAGSYRIVVRGEPQGRWSDGQPADVWFPATVSEPAFHVEVRADDQLAEERDRQTIAKVRQGDAFAVHVSARYPRRALREALEREVSGKDLIAAEGAIDALWPGRNPPAAAAPAIARAIRSHLTPINDGHDEWLMHQLLGMAGERDTPDVVDAVSQVVAARRKGRVHDYASTALVQLKAAPAPATRQPPHVGPAPAPATQPPPRVNRDLPAGLRNQHADEVFRKLNSVVPTTRP